MTTDCELEPDYPAAHSMDTTWYAVDSRGEIAVFSTREEGAVPSHSDNDWEGHYRYIENYLTVLASEGKVTADYSDMENLPSEDINGFPYKPPFDGVLWKLFGLVANWNIAPCMLVLRPGYEQLQLNWKPTAVIPAGHTSVVLFSSCYDNCLLLKDYKKLSKGKFIQKVFSWYRTDYDWMAPWRFGVHEFDHKDWDTPFDLYQQTHFPRDPISVHDFPNDMQQRVMTVRLDTSFSGAKALSIRLYCNEFIIYGRNAPITPSDEIWQRKDSVYGND